MLKKRTVKRRKFVRVNSHSKFKKNRSDENRRGVVEQSILHGVFSEIIWLYFSSAGRYALFRSNKRFKPGD